MYIEKPIECNICGKFHILKKTKQACIDKNNAADIRKSERRWSDVALAAVLRRYRDGDSKSKIAASENLSRSRIGQILIKAERLDRLKPSKPSVLCGRSDSRFNFDVRALSVRAQNCLSAENLVTKSCISSALASGSLRKVPNLGVRTHHEIQMFIESLGEPLNLQED